MGYEAQIGFVVTEGQTQLDGTRDAAVIFWETARVVTKWIIGGYRGQVGVEVGLAFVWFTLRERGISRCQ